MHSESVADYCWLRVSIINNGGKFILITFKYGRLFAVRFLFFRDRMPTSCQPSDRYAKCNSQHCSERQLQWRSEIRREDTSDINNINLQQSRQLAAVDTRLCRSGLFLYFTIWIGFMHHFAHDVESIEMFSTQMLTLRDHSCCLQYQWISMNISVYSLWSYTN